jgi:hypothetical protein
MSGGAKGDYWPGFVDALTNVVIAMVFVIVVLAVSLSFAMQLLSKRMATKVAEQVAANQQLMKNQCNNLDKSAVSNSAQGQGAVQNADLPAVEALVQSRQRIAVRGNELEFSASGARSEVKAASQYLQLEFSPNAVNLDSDAQSRLVQALEPFKQALMAAPSSRMQLVASGPELQISDNQRSAYIRSMAVRNLLIAQGIPPERISMRIETKKSASIASVSLRVEGGTQ